MKNKKGESLTKGACNGAVEYNSSARERLSLAMDIFGAASVATKVRSSVFPPYQTEVYATSYISRQRRSLGTTLVSEPQKTRRHRQSKRPPQKREGANSVQIEKGFTGHWLHPIGTQERLMRQFAGHKRFVWNRALAMEQARYRRGEKMLGCAAMMRQLTRWRNHPDPHSRFLKDAPVHALQCVLWELYESDRRFFDQAQAHPPQFKKKAKSRIRFTESDPALFEIDEGHKRVRLPKLGWVQCRFAQHLKGKPKSVTVRWNGERWILSVQVKVEIADPVHPAKTIVAGDFGVARRITFSDGVVVPPIDVSWEEQRKAFYQRRLKNKTKFSSSWKKIQNKISRLDSRIANIRKDETHQFTTPYSKSHAVLVLGDLNIPNLSASTAGTTEKPGKNVKQKSGLNRSILRQGWGELGRQLEYKASWSGGLVEYQSEADTSQECPDCHHVSSDHRKTQEFFQCDQCGFSANADDVAARNQLQKFLISDKGLALLASGYCASANSLWSGRSWDSAMKQEPIEEVAQNA